MNRRFFKRPKHFRAQAMVEFMLALPLLLIILYGVIEVSRMIFILASVANASRQAARYGAGSGEFDGMTYYQDCEGIRDTANRSAILTEFDDINITYDRGLTSDGDQIQILDINPDPNADSCPIEDNVIQNGDRIIVQVRASYEPIIDVLPVDPLEIVSSSARTFLISVPIFGSALPTGFAAETSTPSRVPTDTEAPRTPTTPPTLTSTLPVQAITPGGSGQRTPTITLPPSATFTPSLTPRPSSTPSITPTAISCTGLTGVSHGPLSFEDNVMYMAIYNNTGHNLTTAQVYVEWNHDSGHAGSESSALHLKHVTLSGQTWSGDILSPSAFITPFYPIIPQGESIIRFYFDQDYDIPDGTERIIVTIGTPGCVNYPIDSSR